MFLIVGTLYHVEDILLNPVLPVHKVMGLPGAMVTVIGLVENVLIMGKVSNIRKL